MLKKYRDITLIELGSHTVAVACDSCAGVGLLEADTIEAEGFIVGYRTALVPLMESLAIGANPKLLVNTLSVSNNSYGQSLIAGITQAAKEAGLTGEYVITGSTEDNFVVPVTALGITVISDLIGLPLPQPLDSDCALSLVGLPKVGSEVVENSAEILTLKAVRTLKSTPGVIDVLPVGSKGIAYEISVMSSDLKAIFKPNQSVAVDMDKSAGPSTCTIVAAVPGALNELQKDIELPVIPLGELYPLSQMCN